MACGDCYQVPGPQHDARHRSRRFPGARRPGFHRHHAAQNTAAQRLFAHITGRLSTRLDGGAYELVADLAA